MKSVDSNTSKLSHLPTFQRVEKTPIMKRKKSSKPAQKSSNKLERQEAQPIQVTSKGTKGEQKLSNGEVAKQPDLSAQVAGLQLQIAELKALFTTPATSSSQLSGFGSQVSASIPIYEIKEDPPVDYQPQEILNSSPQESQDGFYTSLLDRARIQWLSEDWAELAKLDLEQISTNPDRAKLALFAAIGQIHIGNSLQAKKCLAYARKEGCSQRLIVQVLTSGIHVVMLKASQAAGREKRALQHSNDLDRIGLLKTTGIPNSSSFNVVRQLIKPGKDLYSIAAPEVPLGILLAARSAANSGEASSHAARFLGNESFGPTEKFLFLRQVALEFRSAGNKMFAAGFLEEASRHLPPTETFFVWILVKDFLDLGLPESAFELRLRIPDESNRFSVSEIDALRKAGEAFVEKIRNFNGHGQELLLAFAKKHAPSLREACGSRKPLLLEIGTTRESCSGQGSTRRLAEFCHSQGFHFITVDMDRANTDLAAQMFRENNYPFEAVHSKGEDFLSNYRGTIDMAFLDAYDFDHGKHSELRQSRYEKFLGSRIDESECHRMHLECSRRLLPLAAPWMLMCVDDTWLHEGRWTAKGTLAVPHLLENGYHFLDIRNRSVLLGTRYWLETLEPYKPY